MAKKRKRRIYKGILSKNKKGFGFVTCEELPYDIFVQASSMSGAMNGDSVEVELLPNRFWKDLPQGKIAKVMQRNIAEVVGTFERNKKYGFVIPIGKKFKDDVFVRRKDSSGAQRGDIVVARITKYPDRHNSAEGKITEIISRGGQHGGDIKAIARSYGMRDTFPSRVNAEAKAIKKRGVTDEDIKGRRDLREKTTFTIDGADSKDFDDAVSIEAHSDGSFTLGVHIADVSHYVKEDAPLDREALKRGTSVYLIDYVVPMLPESLSNDICSLNPGKDRLTLSVDMKISKEGELISHDIYESVIRSKARLVYDDVSDLLEAYAVSQKDVDRELIDGDIDDEAVSSGEEMMKRYADIKDDLTAMYRLACMLKAKRRKQGSLDFDLDEAHIELNEKGIPVSVETAQRRCANKLIEEFMLLANETVAEHYCGMEAPFIYRIHEKPAADKMEQLSIFLRSMGISLRGNADNMQPRTLSNILDSVKGKPNEGVVSSVTLRSMQKAFYGTSCDGHFGLAFKYYCHFTSPIRRYPDLMIHRIIKAIMQDGVTQRGFRHFRKVTKHAAESSSAAERQAIEAEREVEKLKKAEYMTYHIGEEYDGVISGVTHFGIYVQLENTVEGLIKIDDLTDDYYDYVAEKYALIGEHTGRIYRLGDEISIVVDDVDTSRHEIDFLLSE